MSYVGILIGAIVSLVACLAAYAYIGIYNSPYIIMSLIIFPVIISSYVIGGAIVDNLVFQIFIARYKFCGANPQYLIVALIICSLLALPPALFLGLMLGGWAGGGFADYLNGNHYARESVIFFGIYIGMTIVTTITLVGAVIISMMIVCSLYKIGQLIYHLKRFL